MRFSLLSSYRPVRRPNTGGPTRTTSSTRAIRAAASDERRRYAGTSPRWRNLRLTPPVFGAIGDTFRVFIGTGYGTQTLYALHPQTGATLWIFTPAQGNGFVGAPAAVDARVFAATLGQAPEVYALDQATGAVIWHTPLPGTGSRASVAVAAGRVLVNTDAHELRSFDAATGALQWTAPTSPGATSQESSPAVFLGAEYVGSDNGLYAFNLSTGAPLWPRYPLGGTPGFVSRDRIAPQRTAAGPHRRQQPNHHRRERHHGCAGMVARDRRPLTNMTVAVAEGRVFARHLAEAVALDLNTGALLWSRALPLASKSPAVGGRVVYYSIGNDLVGLDTATGAPAWKGATPIVSQVAGADMAIALEILVIPNGGHVYAFK
jgi:outer membrane protein assembly factor BamB